MVKYLDNMIINYYGEQFFKVSFGDFVMALNPTNQKGGTKFGSDLVLVSAHDEAFNGVDNASHGERKPIVVDGPGEYEIKGLSIYGVGNSTKINKKELFNTSYYFNLEDMNILFLGAFSDTEHIEEIMKKTSSVDIIFVPLGEFLSPSAAYKLAVKFEASIVIPMSYKGEKDPNLVAFEKEGQSVEKIDKLTLKKKDLTGKGGHIIVITQ